MIKTLKDVEKAREITSQLEKLEAPRKVTDRIRRWLNEEAKRLRDKDRGW